MANVADAATPLFWCPFDDNFGFAQKSGEAWNTVELHPEEMALLSPKAVLSRRQQFYLGRAAAHSALAKFQLGHCPILKGKQNEPVWPAGVVGSITHTDSVALAVVASHRVAHGIGIDVERLSRNISWDIAFKVCTPQELEWVAASEPEKFTRLIMLFSAKESVFKAFYPLEKVFLDFLDAVLIWNSQKDQFAGKLQRQAARDYPQGYTFEVGCQRQGDYVLTYLALPATHGGP